MPINMPLLGQGLLTRNLPGSSAVKARVNQPLFGANSPNDADSFEARFTKRKELAAEMLAHSKQTLTPAIEQDLERQVREEIQKEQEEQELEQLEKGAIVKHDGGFVGAKRIGTSANESATDGKSFAARLEERKRLTAAVLAASNQKLTPTDISKLALEVRQEMQKEQEEKELERLETGTSIKHDGGFVGTRRIGADATDKEYSALNQAL